MKNENIVMSASEYLIRYLSLGKFIDLLTTNKFFLCRVDKFEDNTEGEWFAHLSKAANKSINEWQIRSNKSLEKVNQAISKIPSPSLEDLICVIKSELSSDEIIELDISDDMSQVMDPSFFDSVGERIEFLKDVGESYLENVMSPDEEDEYNRKHLKEIHELKKRAYVSSWFSSDSHSIAMWKLYGINEEGIAIRVRKNSLEKIKELNKDFLTSNNAKILFNNVIYVSEEDSEMGLLIDRKLSHDEWLNFRDLLLKHKAYRYEEEFRITVLLEKENDDFRYGMKLPFGSPNDFIDCVYLNPLISNSHWYRNVVLEVMDKYKIDANKLKSGEIKTDFTQ